MGFRTCYPTIWHLDIVNILSWRNLRIQQKQEGHSDFLPFFSHKTGQKTSCERFPPCTQRKGTSLSLKTKGHQEESEQKGFVKFSPVYYTYLILSLSYSSTTAHFLSDLVLTYTSLIISSCLHFITKARLSCKTYIKYICMLYHVNLSDSLICRLSQGP